MLNKKKLNNTKQFENKLDNHLKSSSMHTMMLFSPFFHCITPEVSTSIFKIFHPKNSTFPHNKLFFEKYIYMENFNINNIINVEVAKVLW